MRNSREMFEGIPMKKKIRGKSKFSVIIGLLFIFCLFHPQCVESKSVTTYVVPAITDNKILPNSTIPPSFISDTISLRASPGEFTPASFVIRSNEDIESVTIEVNNLTGSNGEIQSTNIDLRTVKCWYQGSYGSDTSGYLVRGRYLTPELLLKDDSLVYVEGEEWANYDVSNPNGKNYLKVEGSYIDISESSTFTSSIKPTISERPIADATTLQPVTLKQNMNKQFWVTIYIPPETQPGNYTGIITARDGNTILSKIYLLVEVLPITLLEPNLEYSLCYTGYYSSEATISPYKKTIEQLTVEMQNMYDHRITNPAMMSKETERLSILYPVRQQVGMDNSNFYCYSLAFNNIGDLDLIKSTLAPYGVRDVFFYGPDEEPISDPVSIAQMNAIHDAGGQIFAAQSKSEAADVAHILDVAIVVYEPDPDLAALYHSYGHKIYSYGNPQVVPEYPRTFRQNYGLLLWQNDYDGVMDYAYQANWGDIWNDFDLPEDTAYWGEYRDHVFAYPTMNGVIDTIQWEGFREGVDDIRYLTTLQNTISLAKSQGKDTTDAENYLANLKKSDLSSQNLDAVRGQMINHILSLQDQLNPVAEFTANKVYGKAPLTIGSQISSENRHSNLMSIYQIKTNPFKISVLAKKSITLQ